MKVDLRDSATRMVVLMAWRNSPSQSARAVASPFMFSSIERKQVKALLLGAGTSRYRPSSARSLPSVTSTRIDCIPMLAATSKSCGVILEPDAPEAVISWRCHRKRSRPEKRVASTNRELVAAEPGYGIVLRRLRRRRWEAWLQQQVLDGMPQGYR